MEWFQRCERQSAKSLTSFILMRVMVSNAQKVILISTDEWKNSLPNITAASLTHGKKYRTQQRGYDDKIG